MENDSYLTIVLEKEPREQDLEVLKTVPAILGIAIDSATPKKLSIRFQSEKPDEVQFRILELLQQQGVTVLEFSRGSAISDKVVELVRRV